jgi:predicted enzyme related to lactoylglutathione lyase
MGSTIPNGKICYLQIPATDVEASAKFYSTVFGWNLRRRGDGTLAFDDTDGAGAVSGTWLVGRPPSPTPGILVWIMVDDVASTVEAIVAAGGEVVDPISGEAPELIATFRDPGGNVLGVGQQ